MHGYALGCSENVPLLGSFREWTNNILYRQLPALLIRNLASRILFGMLIPKKAVVLIHQVKNERSEILTWW